ncbi:MAG TPA: asparagine synthase (glutamine-hydrolyzing) [Chloroflexi bacterium]|nr:asparagine synthase (glutamine-hydrolyzing) [Chloroflexota bacterium]
MCGICGVMHFNDKPVDERTMHGMCERLAHRGPDGAGLYIDGGLGLGHRRLAILDLSPAGRQPMSYGDDRWWITYNGEVYNFLEVRSELEARGHRFRTDGDTEVILAAYAEWGSACLHKFNGMWAFAIWDHAERVLFLARDRFGVKPLFYLRLPYGFAFASEVKAFGVLPDFSPRVNLPVLKAELLDIHSQEGGPNSLLQDVYRLPGGYWLRVDAAGNVVLQRWWRTLEHLATPPARLEEQAEAFRALFDDACRIRMRSDVPIGASLSGGLDSSAVVCTVAELAQRGGARQAADWQRAFVATFPGTPVDERAYAEAVITRSGVQPTFVEIGATQMLDLLAVTAYHAEQVVDGPLAALWMVYQAQRQSGVVVTLDGHGGDELLAGYPHYAVAALYDAGAWPTRPRRYREVLDIYRGLLSSPADAGPQTAARAILWATNAWLRNLQRLFMRRAPSVQKDTMKAWLGPALQEVEAAPPVATDDLPGASLFRRTLYTDFHHRVLPVILRNYDRMSMAHGVEVRMPFLDWRLVVFVFALPEESLLGQRYTKLVLRRALADRLPPSVLTRRDKIGFSAPNSQWWSMAEWRDWRNEAANILTASGDALWNLQMLTARCIQDAAPTWTELSHFWRVVHASLWLQQLRHQSGSIR